MSMGIEAPSKRVLILAPTGSDGAVLKGVLSNEQIAATVCENIEQLCSGIKEGAGSAIIAEEALSGDALMLLAQTIDNQPEWSDFPMIIMAGAGTEPDMTWVVLSGGKALNAAVLKRPVLTRSLLTAVRASLRSRNQQYRIAEELSKRKQAEEELRRYAEELASANKDLESFSYSVAHDLRNPLRIIKGFISLLIEDCSDKLDDECRDYICRINNGADRMGSIIDDILALSKISRQETSITDVNLSEMARAAIEELRRSQPDHHPEVIIQEGLSARADARLMSITLGNFLGNAWKYTSKTQHPRIEFGAFKKDGKRVYYVKDNGAGFDMSKTADLFTPFKRLHTDKEFKGIGVGLAIVDRAIKRHGGRVWAESEPNKGATFFFTLG